MTPFEERDAQFVEMIRREINTCKERAKAASWHPSTTAWHRAFGEISGMHRILQLVDLDANNVLPALPHPATVGQ